MQCFSQVHGGFILRILGVEDPHHFNAELDPAFHLNADPDPDSHVNADPDLIWASKNPEFWLIWGSWSESSFLPNADPEPASKIIWIRNPSEYSPLTEEQTNINVSICRKLKEEKLEEEEDLVDKEECLFRFPW